MIRNLVVVCMALVVSGVGVTSGAEPAAVRLHRDSVIHFATREESKQILTRRDMFLTSLSRFDLQSRRETKDEVSLEAFCEFITEQILPWDEKQVAWVSDAIKSLEKRLENFHVPLPRKIFLVVTTGKEEGQAAYCREEAIVLPQHVLQKNASEFERLLAHELFHIISRHDAELRRKLYSLVGFAFCEEIPVPAVFKNRKITNPDAPKLDCFIELRIGDKTIRTTPMLYASVNDYDPEKGGSFFRYLMFRLMEVQPDGNAWRAVLKDGQPILHDHQRIPAFARQIGANTNYVIHPDEILADNFVHLVMETPNLRSPEIVADMKKILSQ